MKKDFLHVMFMTLFALCAFTFAACSSDDDDEQIDAATQVAGSYTGTLSVYMLDELMATETKTITLSKNTSTSVNLVIQDFALSVMGMSVDLGDVTISNCALTESNGVYTFSGTTDLTDLEVPLSESYVATIDCTVNFQNATVSGNTLTLPLTVDDMSLLGQTLNLGITADFVGTK